MLATAANWKMDGWMETEKQSITLINQQFLQIKKEEELNLFPTAYSVVGCYPSQDSRQCKSALDSRQFESNKGYQVPEIEQPKI